MSFIDIRQADFSRILIIKPSALGDVVHTLPVLEKLRRRYPRARTDWLLTPENARSALFAVASEAPVRIGFGSPIRRGASMFQGRPLENIPHRGWAGARDVRLLHPDAFPPRE